MATRYYWIGSTGPFKYDDASQVNDSGLVYDGVAAPDQASVITTGQLNVAEAPTSPTHVLREDDIGSVVGDVSGPASSTDGAVVLFDGTSGKLLKDSGITDFGEVLADGTSGRVLRQGFLALRDGTTGVSLKCQLDSHWNGDTDGPTDNVTKGATTGNYALNSAGTILDIQAAAFSGNIVMAFASMGVNSSGTSLTAFVYPISGKLRVMLYSDPAGTAQDITTLVDTGYIYVNLLYLTSA